MGKRHVSLDTVEEFEKAIQHHTCWDSKSELPLVVSRLERKLLYKSSKLRKLLSYIKTPNRYFVVLMGRGEFFKALPWFSIDASSKAMYLFDAWESEIEYIGNKAKQFNVDTIFFSAKQSVDHFRHCFPELKCYWVPEGILVENYSAVNYSEKDIDVLEIGRRHEIYHTAIESKLHLDGLYHLYESVKGEIVFPRREEFIRGLARTKISICFPSNITHPERSGNISTLTQRYLQSMVSKCLIVGETPEDMKNLFSYDPIISADMSNPYEQLKDIIKHYNDYIPLIEKNYQTVINQHQWKHRIQHITDLWN